MSTTAALELTPTKRDVHVLGFVMDHPWAIDRTWLPLIAEVLARHATGEDVSAAVIQAAILQRREPTRGTGGVAIIPVYGVIAPRANALSSLSGGTSFSALSEQLNAAMADPKVGTIVFDVDSPGGSVAGAPEFAAAVRAARTKKPIIAQAQYKMGSAAYWLSASATKIYASKSAAVGSIGVYTIHDDISKALAAKGVTRTYIAAGKHKVTGNEVQPLTEETLALMRGPVDAAYDTFVNDIALGRNVANAAVRSGFGEGRTVTAEEALSLGMIDGISTLEETVNRALGDGADTTLAATDTVQEPSPATIQDRRFASQRQAVELALLGL